MVKFAYILGSVCSFLRWLLSSRSQPMRLRSKRQKSRRDGVSLTLWREQSAFKSIKLLSNIGQFYSLQTFHWPWWWKVGGRKCLMNWALCSEEKMRLHWFFFLKYCVLDLSSTVPSGIQWCGTELGMKILVWKIRLPWCFFEARCIRLQTSAIFLTICVNILCSWCYISIFKEKGIFDRSSF